MGNAYFIKGSFPTGTGGASLPSAPTGPGGVVNTPFMMGHTTPISFTGAGGTWNVGEVLHSYTVPVSRINGHFVRVSYHFVLDNARTSTNFSSLTITNPNTSASPQALHTFYPSAVNMYIGVSAHFVCENTQIREIGPSSAPTPYYTSSTIPTFKSISLAGLNEVTIELRQFIDTTVTGTLHASTLEVW